MQRFEGKNVLITGAAAGIGRATAERIASEGGYVFCVDLAEACLAETVERITGAGGKADWALCDVGSLESIQHMLKMAIGKMGSLDVLINVRMLTEGADVPSRWRISSAPQMPTGTALSGLT